MNSIFLLVVPKRALFTPAQVDRLSDIFLELGKLVTGGVVIGRFIPNSGILNVQFWTGLVTACTCFGLSVVSTRGRQHGN